MLVGVAFVAGLAVFAMVRLFSFVFLAEPRSAARARGRRAGGRRCDARSSSLAAAVLALGLLVPWLSPLFPVPFDIARAGPAGGTWAPSGGRGLWRSCRRSAPAMAAALAPRPGCCAARSAPRDAVRRYHTWDCGQPIDASMEYTATGFSAPVRFFLRDIVRAEKHLVFRPVVAVEPLDPAGPRWSSARRAGSSAALYFPVAQLIEAVGDRLRRLQNGVIQFYIALILATLLVTLWVAL